MRVCICSICMWVCTCVAIRGCGPVGVAQACHSPLRSQSPAVLGLSVPHQSSAFFFCMNPAALPHPPYSSPPPPPYVFTIPMRLHHPPYMSNTHLSLHHPSAAPPLQVLLQRGARLLRALLLLRRPGSQPQSGPGASIQRSGCSSRSCLSCYSRHRARP